ncbi:PilW family protein [Colwellia sp. MB02u-14]|uniref:PilW family protein n=1 Tax=Colwellia sp. MB02u-14 TaxID=2759815 RepID=UPI0015F3AA4D|nr:type II secretion system protein [Colwellia sp. MB02u-14]MBA6304723.1 type II secretion system protein [Colwellia sp. MB02u-14]
MRILSAKEKGFTLVELVTVIIILGVLAVSTTSFIQFGTKSYTDAVDREEITSTARFVIERLNREVRNALPNSVRVVNGSGKKCLEFIPIAQSAIYLDIPVLPEPTSNTITLVPFKSALVDNSSKIAVYALNTDDIYDNNNGVIHDFDSLSPLLNRNELNDSSPAVVLTLGNPANPIHFRADSPTSRIYFIEPAVAFCLENDELYRYKNYTNSIVDNTPIRSNNGVENNWSLMAENLGNTVSPFNVVDVTLRRNALVLIQLHFFINRENIIFSHEIQVPNVP